jgi:putative membrane protein
MRAVRFSRFVPASLVLMWLMLAAGLAQAADTNPPPLSPDEQSFLTRARADNANQIAMAKMALAKSSNPRVIELANSIIQERTALDAQLVQLSGSKHADTEQPAATATARMQTLNGDAFDRSFASSAVRSHCRMISAYEAMNVSSANAALKDFAHQTIPALRSNLTVAMSVLRSSGPTPRPQEAVASVDTHRSKAMVFWEPISLVAAPW